MQNLYIPLVSLTLYHRVTLDKEATCCLYDLDNNGFLDAIFVAIENIKGKSNSWKYVTGHNLNKQGVPMCWR